MDFNGNGSLSLAEIDKAIVELWPQFDHKKAVLRAYKAADRNGDGFIRRREFRLLLEYIIYFNRLWDTFESIDANHDQRLDRDEFSAASKLVGHALTHAVHHPAEPPWLLLVKKMGVESECSLWFCAGGG